MSAEGNLQTLSHSPSTWCLCAIQALWALKPCFMAFVLHPGLLWHTIRPVHSDLRAEKDSLAWHRSPKLPAARESPSITCLCIAPRCPSFISLRDWGSCFCKTMKTLFVSSFPPTAPLLGCPVPHNIALSGERPWRRLGSSPPSGLWLLIC